MQAETRTVRTGLIDPEDRRYHLAEPESPGDLAASISRIGLITPPVLQSRQKGGYCIVSGFRRVSACMQLELDRIEARIVPAGADPIDCLVVAAADRPYSGPPTLGTQYRLAEKILELCGSEQKLKDSMQAAGIRLSDSLLKKFARISRLPENVRTGVAENRISVKTALAMETLAKPSAEALAWLFYILGPSVSQQMEILEGLRDIAGRKGTGIDSVLHNSRFSAFQKQQDADRGRLLRQLRSLIYRLRYPALCRMEEDFYLRKKNLGPGADLDIEPPRNFEDDTYTAKISFSSAEQLRERIRDLERISTHPELEKILQREIENPTDLY